METRATELEAEAQRLREELTTLERRRAKEKASTPAVDGSGVSGSTTDGGDGTILSAQARASFDELAGSLSGPVGVAVSGVGLGQPVEQLGELQNAVAWSTSKVPVAMAAIAAGVADDGDLSQAITASDNAAATRLWNALGGGAQAAAATDAQLRAAGDVIPAHRWGLGATGLPAQLKGGWGPGSSPGADGGYLDRQMGIVTIDGKPLAVAIAAQPGDGSHESGTAALTTLARWVTANAYVGSLPSAPAC